MFADIGLLAGSGLYQFGDGEILFHQGAKELQADRFGQHGEEERSLGDLRITQNAMVAVFFNFNLIHY